jgi:hypothetical protein
MASLLFSKGTPASYAKMTHRELLKDDQDLPDQEIGRMKKREMGGRGKANLRMGGVCTELERVCTELERV